jgi:tetratricopeptide (TPR) repeat protein
MAIKSENADKPQLVQRKPVSAAQRQILQQAFDKGEQAAKRRDFDYATQMFSQCVTGDPGSLDYARAFVETVQKKYNNNKKGSSFAGFKGMGAKAALKKGLNKADFATAVKGGLEYLKLNPWDIPTLMQMAAATAGLGCYDAQLYYLRLARDTAPDPGDVDILRACAEALAKMGQFDQAMACWERVKKYHPNNEEAQQSIASLHTDKISAVGSGRDNQGGKKGSGVAGEEEAELRRQHTEDPTNPTYATELAELLCREERYGDAEEALKQTLDATGGEIKIRELLEDVQLRGSKFNVNLAEKKAAQEPSEEATDLLRRMEKELIKVEIEVYRARSDRYPGNTNWKYEYALRLKLAGNYTEAIKAFQEARGDAKRKAAVFVELGDCFVKIKQFKLAVSNYSTSLENMTDREIELRKRALYAAGVVSMDALADLDSAERFLTELAGHDFAFKDVSKRLDEINRRRNNA